MTLELISMYKIEYFKFDIVEKEKNIFRWKNPTICTYLSHFKFRLQIMTEMLYLFFITKWMFLIQNVLETLLEI